MRGRVDPSRLSLVSRPVALAVRDLMTLGAKHVVYDERDAARYAAPAGDAGAAYDDDAYRRSAEYRAAKDAAADVLWRAIERYIPDARARAKISRVGSPLTHARYLRRDRGTYGALVDAATGELLPGHKTPLPGLFMCGDSTFPGIGVPAVAASALITANSIVSVPQHWRMLDAIKM